MIDYKSLGLTEQDLKEIYKAMDLGRKIDERLWLLNRAGKIPFVVSGQGQEATQIGMAYAMKEGDISAPYYRDLAFVTYMGISAYHTFLAAFGKKEDINSGGKQMPSHFSSREHNILSQSSPVATQIPHAVGAALALKMDDKQNIATATVGEGSSNQGDFHEGLNFAGVHKLPMVCVIINNKYAISVPDSLQYAAKNLSDRAIGYGMFGEQVDGNDPLAVYKAMKEARERALAGEGATLIEAVTSRMTAHSSDDDDQYRTKEERDNLKKADCNEKFKNELLANEIIDEQWLQEIEQEHKEIINQATKAAEEAPYPDVEEAYTYVYEEGSLN
ncbi:thiamine pyrophosphate-dependent dehydrogenase E1 component subunit alpha [Staphylococcus simiae]|uniref:thiamine pyrophosphate-dependent dehydrogenase E1 component subunit alpha n=1 Tax=Staphylococcus simiae TaxID=308354 RepID=UPI001A979A99|nr:thiamine pyrophosphate-dependent dehydrogenase E1 component subunit alpha [Staphylococcus simiae]MBO1197914.1 thiamine pyrophosphate-dependent dehydrogenase E1 component subunit alpha [Staphylococcus simiae]MBO1200105.1 thiamine pyrophosphate-dependent dehydrogenase E1 component subunit alpha [Staphylococcus simiae]MBO1202378.1 thiamine pyrophosphate-dependent dehydrogenase E1 component subunit alpha [Staphylococcus simiae]MBO1209905.1 thiamine pyrophosphate-dependent dehydrogenase E1 compon